MIVVVNNCGSNFSIYIKLINWLMWKVEMQEFQLSIRV